MAILNLSDTMLQPPDVLSSKLFVDGSFVDDLECSICTNVFKDPVQACANGHTFCRGCLQEAMESKNQCPTCNMELTSIASNRIVKNLIENAHVYCFTRLPALEAADISTSSKEGSTDSDVDDDVIDGDEDKDQVGAAATASSGKRKSSSSSRRSSSSSSTSAAAGTQVKKPKFGHCMWTGKLHDARQHFDECVYAGVRCAFGCGAIVLRKDMHEHEASTCPERREVECTNVGCTALMTESMLAAHKTNDCPYEKVDCPFRTVGCNEHLLRKDVKNHTDAMSNQHVILLLQDNQAIKQKVAEQEEENQSLWQENQLLQQQVADQEQRFNNQQNTLVFKVPVNDLARHGEVTMFSDHKTHGAYRVYMCVKKGCGADEYGYLGNGDCCGVHLHLENGTYPCRVTCTLDIVCWGANNASIFNWGANSASAFKHEFTNIYVEETGYGPSRLIPVRKLTAAASPYVNNGHVTFVAQFQILS